MNFFLKACGIALALGTATPSSAALISRTFTFTGTDFVYSIPGITPPYTTLSGSFTIRFDDARSYTNEATGIALHSLSVPMDPFSLVFSYSAAGPPFLMVGGARNGTSVTPISGPFDFHLNIFQPGSANPFGGPLFYTAPGFNNSVIIANRVSLSFVEASAIPEPATWAMMVLGFGFLGGMLRSRNSKHAPNLLRV